MAKYPAPKSIPEPSCEEWAVVGKGVVVDAHAGVWRGFLQYPIHLSCAFGCHLNSAVALAGLKMTPGTAAGAGRKSALSSPIEIVRRRENQSCG